MAFYLDGDAAAEAGRLLQDCTRYALFDQHGTVLAASFQVRAREDIQRRRALSRADADRLPPLARRRPSSFVSRRRAAQSAPSHFLSRHRPPDHHRQKTQQFVRPTPPSSPTSHAPSTSTATPPSAAASPLGAPVLRCIATTRRHLRASSTGAPWPGGREGGRAGGAAAAAAAAGTAAAATATTTAPRAPAACLARGRGPRARRCAACRRAARRAGRRCSGRRRTRFRRCQRAWCRCCGRRASGCWGRRRRPREMRRRRRREEEEKRRRRRTRGGLDGRRLA